MARWLALFTRLDMGIPLLLVLGVLAIASVAILFPTQQLLFYTAIQVGFLVPSLAVLLSILRQLHDIHLALNSRLNELVAVTSAAAHAAGRATERTEQARDQRQWERTQERIEEPG